MAAAGADGCIKPMRRKYWSEMDDKERIEKLQNELIRTQRHLASLSNYVSKLVYHDHFNNRLVSRIPHAGDEQMDVLILFDVIHHDVEQKEIFDELERKEGAGGHVHVPPQNPHGRGKNGQKGEHENRPVHGVFDGEGDVLVHGDAHPNEESCGGINFRVEDFKDKG